MGKRGPTPQRADGFHLTRKGYLRKQHDGRQRLGHTIEWERHHGPVPEGFQVHHINGDKTDNRIENLQLLTPTEHKRAHSPHFRRSGDEWERRCGECGEWKPATGDNYYLSPQGWPLYGRCRPCHIATVVRAKQVRRLRRAAQD